MKLKDKKIVFISVSNAFDKHSWSGTNFYIRDTLTKYFKQVDVISNLKPTFSLFVGRAISALSQWLFKKRYHYSNSVLLSKAYARIINRQLRHLQPDYVIATATSSLLSYIKTSAKVIYIGDSTVPASLNYHKALSNLWEFSKNEILYVEKKAFEKAELLVFSSQWAQQYAVQNYSVKKTAVISFGANMDNLPEVFTQSYSGSKGKCILLFIGVYWDNKGGSIAYDTFKELNKFGIDCELIVCGCVPPSQFSDSKIKVYSFLNKNSEEGRLTLIELFKKSTFLILPTRFDCTPIVFSEANAFGLPCVTCDTGGVTSVVKDMVNGIVLPYDASGKDYATRIFETYADSKIYNSLRVNSRSEYENRLNWETWMRNFAEELTALG